MIEARPKKIGDFNVEFHEIPRSGGKRYLFNTHTQIGVLHTTEGKGVENAWRTLLSKFSPPHFVIGEGRIVQCRPLDVQAAALRGDAPVFANAQAAIQIEMVCYSGGGYQTPTADWIPTDDVLLPTIAVLAYCSQNGIDIPLRVPANWPDGLADVKPYPASNNSRRRSGVWPREKGWYMHMEVPGQAPTWHFDCGALRRTEMLRRAQELLTQAH
jgi:hypothetical protein